MAYLAVRGSGAVNGVSQLHGASPEEVAKAAQVLDPDTLTLGFARRFASYKRANLLLHDSEPLVRILTNRERPVQLVLAGKLTHETRRDKA